MGSEKQPEGGRKNDGGKLRMDLVPGYPLMRLAEVYTIGASKYADDNWRAGISYKRIFAAMLRHAWKWFMGETYDPQDGQHHLSSVAWGAFTLMEYEITRSEFDDRPKNVATHVNLEKKKPTEEVGKFTVDLSKVPVSQEPWPAYRIKPLEDTPQVSETDTSVLAVAQVPGLGVPGHLTRVTEAPYGGAREEVETIHNSGFQLVHTPSGESTPEYSSTDRTPLYKPNRELWLDSPK